MQSQFKQRQWTQPHLFAESHRHVGSSADAPSVGAAAVGRGVGDAHHRGACAAEAAAAAALPAAAATVAAALASGAPLEGGLGVGWGGARLRHLGARRQLLRRGHNLADEEDTIWLTTEVIVEADHRFDRGNGSENSEFTYVRSAEAHFTVVFKPLCTVRFGIR